MSQPVVRPKPLTIFLIEDDEGHAMLIQLNLREAGIGNDIHHFSNGRDVLKAIEQRQKQTAPTPIVVLLDLNLPEVDGYSILATLKSNPRTRTIPIVVLTSTDDPREISRCYELGCNIFLRKPVDYAEFTNTVRQLGLFLLVTEIPDAG